MTDDNFYEMDIQPDKLSVSSDPDGDISENEMTLLMVQLWDHFSRLGIGSRHQVAKKLSDEIRDDIRERIQQSKSSQIDCQPLVDRYQPRIVELLQEADHRLDHFRHTLANIGRSRFLNQHESIDDEWDDSGDRLFTHYEYARRAAPDDVRVDAADTLANRVADACADWLRHLDSSEYFVAQPLREWAGEPDHIDGVFWPDELTLRWAADFGGDELVDRLADIGLTREASQERWVNHRRGEIDGTGLLSAIFDSEADVPARLRPMEVVAEYLWDTEVGRKHELVEAQADGVRHGERQDMFAKADKTIGAFQTRGPVRHAGGDKVKRVDLDNADPLTEVDDQRYSTASPLLCAVTQRWGISHTDTSPDPHNIQLPLAFHRDSESSLPFRVYADSQVHLRPTAAKLLVGLHLLAPKTGGLAGIELGELTGWIYQGRGTCPHRKSNREDVCKNARQISNLEVPDFGEDGIILSHHIEMFETWVPKQPSMEAQLVFGRTKGFQQYIQSLANQSSPISALNGRFVMNADGFMRISGNDSDAARVYLTLCSYFNDQRWDRDRMGWQEVEHIARIASTLSEPARLALEEEGGNGNRLRQDRSETESIIVDKLADEYELVDVDDVRGRGHDREIRVLPNDAHREAYERISNGRDRQLKP